MLAYEISLNRAIDLGALDRFLMSHRVPPDNMMLSDLDGFLTGMWLGQNSCCRANECP